MAVPLYNTSNRLFASTGPLSNVPGPAPMNSTFYFMVLWMVAAVFLFLMRPASARVDGNANASGVGEKVAANGSNNNQNQPPPPPPPAL